MVLIRIILLINFDVDASEGDGSLKHREINKFQLCAQLRVINLAGGNPV